MPKNKMDEPANRNHEKPWAQTLRDDLKLKMKEVEAKKLGTEVLLEEMGAQRSEAEAQQVW